MEPIKFVVDADDEIRALRLACSQFSDQSDDHFSIICGMLVGHVVEQNPESITTLMNNLIAHFQSVESVYPHDLLDCCLRLFGKITLQTLYNNMFKGIRTIYLLETRPHLIVGIVCYYEGVAPHM